MVDSMLDFTVLKVSGSDAKNFLQGLITNDINLADIGTIYTMILNPQGRFLFDLFITKINEDYLLEIKVNSAEKLLSKLRIYKLRKLVEIEHMRDMKVIYAHTNAHHNVQQIHSYQDPRFNKLGIRTIIKANADAAQWNALNNPQNTGERTFAPAYLRDKYEYAMPDGDIDLEYESSIPLEYGAEELRAISYIKGCYVGQELISRTKYQGVVRKKIFKLESDNSISLQNRDIINMDQRKIGVICSCLDNLAIALLRVDDLNSDTISVQNTKFKIIIPEWRSKDEIISNR